jgi:hypothetical protein
VRASRPPPGAPPPPPPRPTFESVLETLTGLRRALGGKTQRLLPYKPVSSGGFLLSAPLPVRGPRVVGLRARRALMPSSGCEVCAARRSRRDAFKLAHSMRSARPPAAPPPQGVADGRTPQLPSPGGEEYVVDLATGVPVSGFRGEGRQADRRAPRQTAHAAARRPRRRRPHAGCTPPCRRPRPQDCPPRPHGTRAPLGGACAVAGAAPGRHAPAAGGLPAPAALDGGGGGRGADDAPTGASGEVLSFAASFFARRRRRSANLLGSGAAPRAGTAWVIHPAAGGVVGPTEPEHAAPSAADSAAAVAAARGRGAPPGPLHIAALQRAGSESVQSLEAPANAAASASGGSSRGGIVSRGRPMPGEQVDAPPAAV